MITLKSEKEIETMARAGKIVGATLALMRQTVRPGVSTEDLDAEAERFIRSHAGAVPSFKGLYGFPKSLCVSINEEIVHGIPSTRRILREGSIVSVDCGVHLQGFHADAAITVPRFRFVLGITYAPMQRDSDGDGVPDRIDRCPSQPGERGGQRPGCPKDELVTPGVTSKLEYRP